MPKFDLLVFVTAIAVTLLTSDCSAAECCPSLWTQFNATCYRYIGKYETWISAESICQELAENVGNEGHLVSIHSAEENEFVRELWTSSSTPRLDQRPSNNALWIGLHNNTEGTELSWSDASQNDFTLWRTGYNTIDVHDDCCHIVEEGSSWRCDCNFSELPFVCKLGPELVSIAGGTWNSTLRIV